MSETNRLSGTGESAEVEKAAKMSELRMNLAAYFPGKEEQAGHIFRLICEVLANTDGDLEGVSLGRSGDSREKLEEVGVFLDGLSQLVAEEASQEAPEISSPDQTVMAITGRIFGPEVYEKVLIRESDFGQSKILRGAADGAIKKLFAGAKEVTGAVRKRLSDAIKWRYHPSRTS